MKNSSLWLLPLALLTTALPAQPRINVNLYDSAGLRSEVREDMKRETAKIFRQAGVEMAWVECEIAGKALNMAECARPLSAARLMLQLVPGANKENPKLSGLAIVQRGSSFFACLYPERVKNLARDGNWAFGDLLGHAAAHELGHLLQESTGHSPAGVMRSGWEPGDLRRLTHSGLIFLPGQLAVVQASVYKE